MAGPTAPRDVGGPGPADEDFQARFDIVPATGPQPATVRAAGDIDLDNAGQFQAALTEAAAASGDITVDMTAVTYCDSAAVRVLLTAARHGRLTLVIPGTGPITTMLKIAGLDQITTVVTTH